MTYIQSFLSKEGICPIVVNLTFLNQDYNKNKKDPTVYYNYIQCFTVMC